MDIVAVAVFAVLYSFKNVMYIFLLAGEKRDAFALRNQIARLPLPSDAIGQLGVSMETSCKRG